MNLSVLQGRLSSPDNGYQETPTDWHREFQLLNEVGLTHVEWVITKNQFFNNPFFTNDLNKFSISAVCADNAVDNNIFNRDFFIRSMYPICEKSIAHGINTVTLPLLDESQVDTDEKKHKIISLLAKCCKRYPQLRINIEAELDSKNLLDIILSHKNLKITYDTGNLTALNFDHKEYIAETFNHITNVHLKDRKFNKGGSQILFEGDTDFDVIFSKLSTLGYKGFFTLQVAREKPGNEIDHIKKIANTFRRMYEQYF